MQGINACRTRGMLPAVPTSNLNLPDLCPLGLKTNSVEPCVNPSVCASQSVAIAFAAVTCCGCRPGFGRLYLIFVM